MVSEKVWDRLDSGEHRIRLHVFSEFFAIMTGRGIMVRDANGPARFTLTPEDAAKWIREFSAKVQVMEITESETLSAFDQTGKKGVTGARIYDYMHAVAADKAKSDELLTRNTADFFGLTKAAVVWP